MPPSRSSFVTLLLAACATPARAPDSSNLSAADLRIEHEESSIGGYRFSAALRKGDKTCVVIATLALDCPPARGAACLDEPERVVARRYEIPAATVDALLAALGATALPSNARGGPLEPIDDHVADAITITEPRRALHFFSTHKQPFELSASERYAFEPAAAAKIRVAFDAVIAALGVNRFYEEELKRWSER